MHWLRKREEEGAGVDVVVEGEGPDVALHRGQNLLGEDREQGDEERGQHPVHCSGQAEAAGLVLLKHFIMNQFNKIGNLLYKDLLFQRRY